MSKTHEYYYKGYIIYKTVGKNDYYIIEDIKTEQVRVQDAEHVENSMADIKRYIDDLRRFKN